MALLLIGASGATTIDLPFSAGVVPGQNRSLFAGFGRTGNGLVGAVTPVIEPVAVLNVVDRRIPAGAGNLLVTDFDSGLPQHNALHSPTVNTVFFDNGFTDPSLLLNALGDGTSALPSPGFAEGTTADGDSGGPLFVYDTEAARWELAAIASWGTNPLFPSGASRNASRYGDLAFYTDLTPHHDWIRSTIPEPSVSVLLALGFAIAIVLCRNRGRTVPFAPSESAVVAMVLPGSRVQ